MGGTGIVRDDLFIEHNPGEWHPESPDRLRAIHRVLDSHQWPGQTVLPRRFANFEEIALVHRPEHFRRIAQTDGQTHGFLDADTQTSAQSFQAALAAAGGLISLTEKIIDGDLDNGFAFVRPPGHHAEANRAMGFCLFNNVAIAAAWAIAYRNLSRIMIVDWDLHHGNGTQNSFYDDPRVLYISTHQYPYYPGTGSLAEVGRGKGEGFTINVPLSAGHGDNEYIAIFKEVIIPAARVYKPELILISAGFDTYRGDPLGGMLVSPEGYAAMTLLLKEAAQGLCQGRLVITLEGGYHIEGQAAGVAKVMDVLTGADSSGTQLARMEFEPPGIVSAVKMAQQGYWEF